MLVVSYLIRCIQPAIAHLCVYLLWRSVSNCVVTRSACPVMSITFSIQQCLFIAPSARVVVIRLIMDDVVFYRSGLSKHLTAVSLPPESIILDLESTPVCECCFLSVCLHCFVNIFLDT